MTDYGILTLLPAIAVIVLAIKTKRTTEPLIIGFVLSYIIIDGVKFVPSVIDSFFSVITDYDNVWIIVTTGFFGSLIVLLNASHGTHAFAKSLSKICNNGKKTLVFSWIMGIVIFIDDYLNIMTINSCMRRISDRNKEPRESLAYVVDSTGSPTCVLLPFSGWAIFYSKAFFEQEAVKNLGYKDAMATYVHAIPFIFYASVSLIVVLLFALGIIPRIGAMKKAYERVEKTGMVYSETSKKFNLTEENSSEEAKSNIIDFIVPMGLMIAITVVYDDILLGLIAAILSCIFLYVPRKLITMEEFCDLWIKGFADTIPMSAIIVAALCMRTASSDINLPEYVIRHVMPIVTKNTFPAMAFLVVSALAFITGSNWGIPAVCVPIVIPLGAACGANILLVMGAIVSGGVFSSHACYYSDTTVLTSAYCGVDNVDHVTTQMPYAIIGLIISFIAFLICGFVM